MEVSAAPEVSFSAGGSGVSDAGSPPVQFPSRSLSTSVGSDTHPGLLEAVGPPAIVWVVGNVLGLLELLPQPLYPVVVARS